MRLIALILLIIVMGTPSLSIAQAPVIDPWGVTESDWLSLNGPEFRRKIDAANRRQEILDAANRGDVKALTIAAGAYTDATWGPPNYSEAFRLAKKAAEQGLPRAMVTLGTLLHNGQGATPNKSEAFAWYKAAAELGQVQGMQNVASMLERGDGVPRDGAMAMLWYRRAAERGDPQLVFNLAGALWRGVGGSQDNPGAFAVMERAAEGGHPEAMYWYGIWLTDSSISGRQQSEVAATSWLRRAMEAGYADATYNYAARLFDGLGVTPNPREAMVLIRMSASGGDIRSQYLLGTILVNGRNGIQQSRAEARQLFSGIVSNSNSPTDLVGQSLFNLGALSELDQQNESARNFYRQARDAGYVDRTGALGRVESQIAANARLSQQLARMEQQCNSGNGMACGQLSDMYNGQVGQANRAPVPRDVNRSFHFARRGCALNDAMACLQEGMSYQTGVGVRANREMAIAALRKAIRLDPNRNQPVSMISGAARGSLRQLGATP